MESRRLDRLARAIVALSPRRRLIAAALALLPATRSGGGAEAARCKKPGKRCDRNSDCCDSARCKRRRCRCPNGQSPCGRTCRDLSRDPLNCGWCGKGCGPGNACIDGACVI